MDWWSLIHHLDCTTKAHPYFDGIVVLIYSTCRQNTSANGMFGSMLGTKFDCIAHTMHLVPFTKISLIEHNQIYFSTLANKWNTRGSNFLFHVCPSQLLKCKFTHIFSSSIIQNVQEAAANVFKKTVDRQTKCPKKSILTHERLYVDFFGRLHAYFWNDSSTHQEEYDEVAYSLPHH